MIEDFDKDLFKKCMPFFSERPVVFDIGAHKGAYTDFVLEQVPGANCYLFEPNSHLFEGLRNKYPNAYCLAVSDEPGEREFHVCPQKNDELSSLYKRKIFDETGYESIKMSCTSIHAFCTDNNISAIDYLKIDVEGAEKDVIMGAGAMMHDKRIKFIQFEYGSTYVDAGIQFTDIIKYAAVFGYKTFDLIHGKFTEVTQQDFINDYRYSVFLLTYIDLSCS